MVAMFTFATSAWRGRNDDGSQTTATWKANQNTNWSQDVDTNFRVRFRGGDTGGASGTWTTPQLQYNLNAVGWNNVTSTSAVVQSSDSPNFTDGAATTTQLTGGSGGTFAAGTMDEVDGACASISIGASGNSEVEFCVQIRSVDVANGDTVELRVLNNAAAPTETNSHPSVTVVEATPTPVGNTDLATSWKVAARVTSDLATLWRVYAPVAASDLVTSWKVLTGAAPSPVGPSDLVTSWRVLARVTSDLVTSWRVSAPVGASDLTTSWRVLAPVGTSDLATSWRVLSSLVSVTSDLVTSWRVAARITSDLATSWRVFTPVASDLATSWRVYAPVAATDLVTSWRVLQSVLPVGPSDLATSWKVSTLVGSSDLVTSWKVLVAPITLRPSTGTTARPNTGTTARPFAGVTSRP